MAPFIGPTRAALLQELGRAQPRLPITLGKYAPQATVERDGEDWVLRPLVLDKEASQRAYEAAMGPGGSGYWMPESEFQFLRPGDALVRAPTREAFVAAIEKIEWRWS